MFYTIVVFVSSLPAIAVLIWFKCARYPYPVPLYALSLFAGLVSFFTGVVIQSNFKSLGEFIISSGSMRTEKWAMLYKYFIQVAFSEELSRLILLIIVFIIIKQTQWFQNSINNTILVRASGLIAGFGFTVLESTVLGISSTAVPMLRLFSAAPLHGACGFRVASSITKFKEKPIKSVSNFLSAVIIHGSYNLLISRNHFPSQFIAFLVVIFTLSSSVVIIFNEMKGSEEFT
ncbi:MAG: PrsW family glutamic-type intramembrane protease [Treponema sp.]|nr:PrsW family glutamic-type intramembrane protease [Treponema sp.]